MHTQTLTNSSAGFSLVELMIAMAAGLVIIGAAYQSFTAQQKIYAAQDRVTEMQQNARAGLDFMTRELRMAGYNPRGIPTTVQRMGIVAASAHSIRFTRDMNGDGNTNGTDPCEDVTYALYDAGLDGDLDLGRSCGGGKNEPVAENITSLDFVYMWPDPTDPINKMIVTSNPDPNQLSQIRTIQITLTAQTASKDPNRRTYRKITMVSSVRLRNF